MKLRVISGRLGGRQFAAPQGHKTHPMSERIRGAMFNVLGNVEGLTVLDTYAGSGAVSFEAISRSAKNALLIEQDRIAARTIRENIELLGVEDATQLIQGNVVGWSNNHQQQTFDIVVCDPPYDAVLSTVIEKIARHVGSGGLLVLSWPAHVEVPKLQNMNVLATKMYGNAQLIFYKHAIM
jgi:16S rRNA (guanine966-N2)-methyltransferase